MSIYEQYHSNLNRDYMFNLVKEILKSEDNIIINNSTEELENFNKVLEDIFNNNNAESIAELNKILLDDQLKYYRDKYNHNQVDAISNNVDGIPKTLQELVNERELEQQNLKKVDFSSSNSNTLNIDNVPSNSNNIFLEDRVENINKGTPLNDLLNDPKENIDIQTDDIVEPVKDEESNTRIINISSYERTNINSSRYNYKVDLEKKNIKSEELQKISRLIIPIEDNYIFTIPILKLNIPELEYDNVYMHQTELITNNKNSIAIYEPIKDIFINKKGINKLTIDIRDITDTKYDSYDIQKINIIEIMDNVIIFTCSNINYNNFKINDSIKVINTYNFTADLMNLLRSPFSIQRIVDNQIFCRLPYNTVDSIYNNIDMKILNMSNQNVLFFN